MIQVDPKFIFLRVVIAFLFSFVRRLFRGQSGLSIGGTYLSIEQRPDGKWDDIGEKVVIKKMLGSWVMVSDTGCYKAIATESYQNTIFGEWMTTRKDLNIVRGGPLFLFVSDTVIYGLATSRDRNTLKRVVGGWILARCNHDRRSGKIDFGEARIGIAKGKGMLREVVDQLRLP